MKTIATVAAAILMLSDVAFAQGNVKPQAEVIMSGLASTTNDRHSATITNYLGTWGATVPVELVFDVGPWLILTNVTFLPNVSVTVRDGVQFGVATNVVLNFANNKFRAGPDDIFYGSGMVSGTVYAMTGCWQAWSNSMTPGTYALTCDSIEDPLGGDLYGTIENAQIKTGAVTTVEILNYTILPEDLSASLYTLITNPPVPSVTGAYAFAVGMQFGDQWTLPNNGYYYSNVLMYAKYGTGWSAGPVGSNLIAAAAGFWDFTTTFGVLIPPTVANDVVQYSSGIWVDQDCDGVRDESDPQIVGSADTIDLSLSPYTAATVHKAFQSRMRLLLTNGAHCYPFIFYSNFTSGANASMVEHDASGARLISTYQFEGQFSLRNE